MSYAQRPAVIVARPRAMRLCTVLTSRHDRIRTGSAPAMSSSS